MNTKPQHTLLIVEDEAPMRRALEDLFLAEGFRVETARHGEEALERVEQHAPDLIVMDVMMPKLDGFEVAKRLRRVDAPILILMLTAKATVNDRVEGLNLGADDYLTKPFHSAELLARVRALLRRSTDAPNKESNPQVLELGPLKVDFRAHRACRGDQELALTSKEFGLLRMLAEAEGQAISRDRFLDRVWGYEAFPTTRTVDTHIASLRAKIARVGGDAERIETVHGIGYRLRSIPGTSR